MATYHTREVETKRLEWVVPAELPWGACWTDVMKAISGAHQELVSLGLLVRGRDASDDTIRMIVRDEEIVVFFTLERSGDGDWRTV